MQYVSKLHQMEKRKLRSMKKICKENKKRQVWKLENGVGKSKIFIQLRWMFNFYHQISNIQNIEMDFWPNIYQMKVQ